MHLLERGKLILANNFIYYLNSVHSVNFGRNLWKLECIGTEESDLNDNLAKEIFGKQNRDANVFKKWPWFNWC